MGPKTPVTGTRSLETDFKVGKAARARRCRGVSVFTQNRSVFGPACALERDLLQAVQKAAFHCSVSTNQRSSYTLPSVNLKSTASWLPPGTLSLFHSTIETTSPLSPI